MVSLLVIWGLLAWGNFALINWVNSTYQERMASNYLVNAYEGRVLLNQDEYTDFKKSLLDDDVEIKQLDVYGSADVLVIYNIRSPQEHIIPFVGEPKSQGWHYERSRAMDYVGCAFLIVGSLVAGIFLSIGIEYEANI